MKLHFFDNDKAFVLLHKLVKAGGLVRLGPRDEDLCHEIDLILSSTKHGVLGPDHAGTVEVDYTYQAEQWVQDMHKDAKIVRWFLDDGARSAKWERQEGQIVMTMRAGCYEGEWKLGAAFP